MNAVGPTESESYSGEELVLFEHATRWKRYLGRELGPYLHGDVLEIGAGRGGTTAFLLAPAVTSWCCLEPDPELRAEIDRSRQRLAGLSAEVGRLEEGNHRLAGDLARTRDQLARGARFNKTLRDQRDRDLRHIRALTADAQTLRGGLARAHAELRRLHGGQGGDPRRAVEMRQRDTAMAREIEELRRYNGYLL